MNIYSVEITDSPLTGGRQIIKAATPEAAAQQAAVLCGETLEGWKPRKNSDNAGTGRTATRRITVYPSLRGFGLDGKPRK